MPVNYDDIFEPDSSQPLKNLPDIALEHLLRYAKSTRIGCQRYGSSVRNVRGNNGVYLIADELAEMIRHGEVRSVVSHTMGLQGAGHQQNSIYL